MKISAKMWALAAAIAALAGATAVLATVTVSAGPTSLVTSPVLVKASSNPVGLFEVSLNQDAGETLSSVSVKVNANATSTVSGADLASVAVYKDNGDGVFNPGVDLLAGSNTAVNVGSTTVVTTAANNALTGGKFFVALSTSASWSDGSPADSVTATMPAGAIVTSANSPTTSAVTTAAITADTSAPTLTSATAKNTGGTSAKEAGDSVELKFSEPTDKPAVNASNLASFFTLNNSHSFLDGAGALGTTAWNVAGDVLTITLSASSSVPSVAVGDTVTVVTPSAIKDLAGNGATGSKAITGSFTSTSSQDDENNDDDDEDNDDHACVNTLVNGELYKINGDETVYLAADCRLKPFRGAAVFHARGKKFQNVITLGSLPANAVISQKPVLPASGTLVKGSDRTIWFVTEDGHRRGFKTAEKYLSLGFRWGQAQDVSDADLTLIPVDQPIGEGERHPDGTLLKCEVSGTVYQIIGDKKFPFRTADSYLVRGHTWTNLVSVDCKQYNYVSGAPVE